MTTTAADLEKAALYTAEAAELRVSARDLAHFADEVITETRDLHDSSPKLRAGLAIAAAFRKAANACTDGAETYEMWAADHLAHANELAS